MSFYQICTILCSGVFFIWILTNTIQWNVFKMQYITELNEPGYNPTHGAIFFLWRNPWAGPDQLIFAMDIHGLIFEQNIQFLNDFAYLEGMGVWVWVRVWGCGCEHLFFSPHTNTQIQIHNHTPTHPQDLRDAQVRIQNVLWI